jgi:hypothetical protein
MTGAGGNMPGPERTSAPNLFDALADALVRFLDPIRSAVDDPRVLGGLLGQIGVTTEYAGGDVLANALASLFDLADQVEQLSAQPSPSFADIEAVIEAARKAFTALRGLSAAGGPAENLEGLGIDLADLLILLYLWNWHRLTYKVALLATVIQPASETEPRAAVMSGDTVLRAPFQLDQFRLRRLTDLLVDPVGTLRAEYGKPLATVDDANAMADKLFPRIRDVLRELGVSCRYGFNPADAPLLNDSAPIVDHALIIYLTDPLLGEEVEAGVVLTLSSADRGDLGLVVSPFGTLTETFQVGNWQLQTALTADVQAFAYGRHGLTLLASPATAEVGATVTATLQPPDDSPAVMIGSPTGSRLEIGHADIAFQTTLSQAQPSIKASADALKSALVIAGGDGDGFLRSVLPSDGLQATFDLGLAWSSEGGFTFRGAAGLDTTLPVDISILGVFTVPTIHLGLLATDTALVAEVSASIGLAIGPIQVLVDRVGITSSLLYGDGGGSLGVGEWDFAFKPPSAVGLVVDAAGVTGGGFLGIDPASGRYGGVLELRVGQIDITAVGLLDTKLPPGQGDYALLLMLHARFPAIQIGFGFALTGVGGLLGLNRRVNVDMLRGRLAAGTAGRILAPQDPIRNAPALLADLGTVFPLAPGITVVGPTLQLLWVGLVHLDVGVFIELPGPSRVVLLGSAHAVIEREGRALLSVRVDIVGVVDLGAETAAFDAVLIDSHLMGMLDLTGGAAFRLSWGAQPYAVLSLGGFHPAYHPEPLAFPSTLTRIAMVHGTPTEELYLRFEGYFAVTSNTLQFGASVEVLVQAGGFVVHGNLGFDALIQFAPFHFQIDIRASVTVAFEGHSLTGLTLTGSLTGPGPTVLHAKVCIELLFVDICFSGTFPLGPAVELVTPPADLFAVLVGELEDPARLRASGAPDPHVRLRPPDPALTTPLVAPTGTLVWEQQRAPLSLLVTRVGGTPLPAPAQVTAKGAASSTPASDWFAPGQFLDLSDDEALTRPAYELLASGLRLVGTGVVDGPSAQGTLSIDQIRLPAKVTTKNKGVGMFPAWIVASPARPATPMVAVASERWILTTPSGERHDLTGAQARQLAALTPAAHAVPATDRLAALAF